MRWLDQRIRRGGKGLNTVAMKVFVEDLCQAVDLYCLTAAYVSIYIYFFPPKIWLICEECHSAKEKTKNKNLNKKLTKYIYAPYYVL